ncbi:pyridoxal-phosphate dependent enzyme [Streptomyces sp. NPDC048172]|uniref:threonine synthase n=1 Tax=Streptomyces sp. NPDC048172 TaxID=3365505 RepID=UPI00371E38D6
MTDDLSRARRQVSLGDPAFTYPLWPPMTAGCPRTSTETVSYPVEVDYAYDEVDGPALFAAPGARGDGIGRWAPLLPPLVGPGLAEGGTPLVPLEDGVYVKDESRNPTWSHKDRLNRVAVSAAVRMGAPGIVVASSGNHGASAAAYAARAGLPCVVIASSHVPPAVLSFLRAYGAEVLPVPEAGRWPVLRQIVERCGLHPVSNLTPTHTGHAFGPEGYKTVAYELFADLGTVPSAVYVPVGYGELLFGVGKGFEELRRLGVTDRVPRLFSAEPDAGGPLAAAVRAGVPATHVEVGPTDAYAIDSSVGGYRARYALGRSGGEALLVSDAQLREAQRELAGQGMWAELSSAAGLAAYRAHRPGPVSEGPVVCVSTSSGFKDLGVGTESVQTVPAEWDAIAPRLRAAGLLDQAS